MNTFKRNSFGVNFRLSFLQYLILPVILLLLNQPLQAQDTINPFGIRTPFEITEPEPANFPFQYPDFIGDINGDDYGDFVFNYQAADERTPDPMDGLYKSAIVTNINVPGSCQVLYGTYLKGIKDYNGDGYDDVLDMYNRVIRFGSPTGLSEDTLMIDYPYPFQNTYETILYYAGDISNDGKSEFIIGQHSDFDTVYLYSGPGASAIITDVPDLLFTEDKSMFQYYDFDQDNVKEFVASGYYYPDNQYKTYFYNFDTIQQKLIKEKNVNVNVLTEPYYTSCYADINGDGRPDITHNYYTSADKFGVEVNFGQDASPYFSEPVQIPAGNLNRLFYVAGDVNNDGADDWYSLTDEDSVTIYFGNADIVNQGFIKEKYFTGENQQMYALGEYFSFHLEANIPVLFYDTDSVPDILLNFWTLDDNLRFDTIGCAIICGGESLDFTNPLVLGRKADESYPDLQYGYRTTNLGDMNNDGIEDWGTLAMMDCYAEIFFGSPDFDTSPDIRILLPQVERTACYDWSSGDLNGDDLIDLAISNSSEMDVLMVPGVFNEVNRVYVFYGRENWPFVLSYQDADEIVVDTSYFHEFGSNIGIIGDYNGDGYDDMVIGGVRYTTNYRKVYVYLGGHFISEQPDMILSVPGSNGSYTFGDPITACGDINADGFDDFALGDSHGRQSLLYFGGFDADDQYDAVIKDPSGGQGYNFGGSTVRNKGDYDGDGYPDLVQASYYPIEGAYIFKGGPGFDTIFDYHIADTSINYMGPEMLFIEGFTDKGKSDLIISQSNSYKSSIFSNVESVDIQPDYVLQNGYHYTLGIASADFNNDGYVEICTGHSWEFNYGNPHGGIIQFYRSPVMTGTREEYKPGGSVQHIYPNPANNTVTVTFPPPGNGNTLVTLTDLTGKTLLKKQYLAGFSKSSQSIELNTSSLVPGVYIIHAENSQTTFSEKLIIAR